MESYCFVIAAITVAAIIFIRGHNYWVLYALAGTASLTGLHIYLGVSFYLSRLILIAFIGSLLIKHFQSGEKFHPSTLLTKYFLLFSLLIFFQIISTALSMRIPEGFRQIAIYLALIAIFIVVAENSKNAETISKSIKIYIAIGFIQGIYGIYQVIGGSRKWLTYQNLLADLNIQTINDHTNGGYIYSSLYGTFRAIGFYPADMSHYAGYMVGIVILAIALLSSNHRLIWPKIVIAVGIAGILLSLSRSGIITLGLIGLPSIFFLSWRVQPRGIIGLGKSFIVPATIGIGLAYLVLISAKLDFETVNPLLSKLKIELLQKSSNQRSAQIPEENVQIPKESVQYPQTQGPGLILKNRFGNLVGPSDIQNESLNEHIQTRLAGLAAFASSPLLGVGLGVNAKPWYEETHERGWAGSHSHHLDILGQTGLIGALLQFVFMFMVGRNMWKGLFLTNENSLDRHLLAGLMSTYIAIILGNFMYHYFTLDIVWFLMGCGVGLSNIIISKAKK